MIRLGIPTISYTEASLLALLTLILGCAIGYFMAGLTHAASRADDFTDYVSDNDAYNRGVVEGAKQAGAQMAETIRDARSAGFNEGFEARRLVDGARG